jgi:hypothetical protein
MLEYFEHETIPFYDLKWKGWSVGWLLRKPAWLGYNLNKYKKKFSVWLGYTSKWQSSAQNVGLRNLFEWVMIWNERVDLSALYSENLPDWVKACLHDATSGMNLVACNFL